MVFQKQLFCVYNLDKLPTTHTLSADLVPCRERGKNVTYITDKSRSCVDRVVAAAAAVFANR